jgi:hypothetical protein
MEFREGRPVSSRCLSEVSGGRVGSEGKTAASNFSCAIDAFDWLGLLVRPGSPFTVTGHTFI